MPTPGLHPPAKCSAVPAYFLKKRIGRRFRRALSRDFGLEPRDFVLEQTDPAGEFPDGQQRQVLADLVGDFLLRQVVRVDSGHDVSLGR